MALEVYSINWLLQVIERSSATLSWFNETHVSLERSHELLADVFDIDECHGLFVSTIMDADIGT